VKKKSLQNRTNMSYRFAYAFRAQTQKKIPLKKKTFVKHFSQIQKENHSRFAKCVIQTEQAQYFNTSKPLFLKLVSKLSQLQL